MTRSDPLANFLFNTVTQIKKEVSDLLVNVENSKHRIVTVETAYHNLAKLSVKQDKLLKEAIDCVKYGFFRASQVLAWSAMVDVLIQIYIDKIDKTRTYEDLRSEFNDYRLIEQLRVKKIIDKGQEKILKGYLATRDEAAHPSELEPDYDQSVGYISQLIARIEYLKKKKILA